MKFGLLKSFEKLNEVAKNKIQSDKDKLFY